MNLRSIRAHAVWVYCNAEEDPKNAVKCPFCHKPAFQRIIDSGAYDKHPLVTYVHKAIVTRGQRGLPECMSLESCQ